MGIKLMVEVLDHYRGPDHKFRWLMAFAEKAKDATRTGWPGRDLMARRTCTSPNRVSHTARELIDDGVLERAGAAGRGRGKAGYTLLPLAPSKGVTPQHPKSAHRVLPDDTLSPPIGCRPATPKGVPEQHPMSDPYSSSFNPHLTLTPPGGDASAPPTAQTILGAFIDWDRASGGNLTRRVIGQLAKHISDLIAEGIDDRYIRIGLAEWRAKGQHPATLDSFVSAAMNGHATGHQKRVSTGDRAIAEAEELKAQLRNHKGLA